MSQTPIQKKIEELVNNGDQSWEESMFALAQYIKEEVVPEEIQNNPLVKDEKSYITGLVTMRNQVVDKFKEMGI